MNLTVFNTPILKHFLKLIGSLFLKLTGWKLVSKDLKSNSYIIFVYPHTSNWDFPIGLAGTFKLGLSIQWMGKSSLFWGPAGPIMKWLGGVPIDRTTKNDIVSETIKKFGEIQDLKIVIPAEGTRKYRDYIKSGFYHIAIGAKIPVVLGYLDYSTKTLGLGEEVTLTGDVDQDLAQIAKFYDNKKGRSEKDAAPIRFRKK